MKLWGGGVDNQEDMRKQRGKKNAVTDINFSTIRNFCFQVSEN